MGITGKAADLLAVVRLVGVQVTAMRVDLVAVRLISMIVGVQVSTMCVKIDVLVMQVVSLRALDVDIIVRVVIIRDQGTPIIVTSQLYFISVDLVHGHDERLAVDLNDRLMSRDGRGCQLSINMRMSLDVASNDL